MPIETGRYCSHCVDETGTLQSFDDRFERMIAWEARRRPDVTRTELEASTLAYMATMPAWRDHPRVAATGCGSSGGEAIAEVHDAVAEPPIIQQL
jgi:hypothetical protein